jgi:hypothetical protein
MTKQRRPWTSEEITKLMSMAQKCPPAQIASEIGRPLPSAKAHDLFISLRMDRHQRQTPPMEPRD